MSFSTHTNNGLLWLSSSLLDGQPVRHGFSTRLGGLSKPAHTASLNTGFYRGDKDIIVQKNIAPLNGLITGRNVEKASTNALTNTEKTSASIF